MTKSMDRIMSIKSCFNTYEIVITLGSKCPVDMYEKLDTWGMIIT